MLGHTTQIGSSILFSLFLGVFLVQFLLFLEIKGRRWFKFDGGGIRSCYPIKRGSSNLPSRGLCFANFLFTFIPGL